jgi:putative phosphoesterase
MEKPKSDVLVAVMSDSHDQIWNIRKAVSVIIERKPVAIIHCGDFVAPFTLKELDRAGIPVHGVFGNNDGDQYLLTRFSLTAFSHITFYGRIMGELETCGFQIGFAHERVIADGLLYSGKYHLVCFGHTHKFMAEKIGKTLLLNPGEIMGKDEAPGFALVNLFSGEYERIFI